MDVISDSSHSSEMNPCPTIIQGCHDLVGSPPGPCPCTGIFKYTTVDVPRYIFYAETTKDILRVFRIIVSAPIMIATVGAEWLQLIRIFGGSSIYPGELEIAVLICGIYTCTYETTGDHIPSR